MNDVIIIGGSFAGLAAALQLGRARRKVTVLDTDRQRNRFAGHSHGVLGHDHKPPLDILAEARQQLARYPTIRLVTARAESVSGTIDDFCVVTDDNESLRARRLILSYGVADQMPDIPGFAEGWGTYVIPCPYCDGFEVADQHWGLVWSGPQSNNQVRLFHDWTDRLTVFGNGHDITPDIRTNLAARQVHLVDGRITGIARNGSHNVTIRIETGLDVAGVRLENGNYPTLRLYFVQQWRRMRDQQFINRDSFLLKRLNGSFYINRIPECYRRRM
ncbi:NAD(P)/FAD-dependent oxidoreductase [Klebsiella pneumoniae]|uniref:NAD(P)/FAD-dependent oxidoreductase n=1 Tax=Klebsiella pneumoniae TaxID=573 RepID=UPI002DBE19D4|nr:NAD(P)/FAD-dependent oxidoreductase [Klebsiella pneumoniae]MEB8245064.1 NAD(P)/FAD-dependent oxidoreductase [Klebsiella pneumoniae]